MLSPWGCSDTEEGDIPRMLSPQGCRTAPHRAPNPGSPPAAPSLVACQAGRALGADSAAGWSPAAPRYRRRAPICWIAALGAFQILLPRGAALTHGEEGRLPAARLPPFRARRRCHLVRVAAEGSAGCLAEAFGSGCRHAPVLQTAVQAPRGSHGRLPLPSRAAALSCLRVSPPDIRPPGGG